MLKKTLDVSTEAAETLERVHKSLSAGDLNGVGVEGQHEKWEISIGFHGKTRGKPEENHGKTMGKPWGMEVFLARKIIELNEGDIQLPRLIPGRYSNER